MFIQAITARVRDRDAFKAAADAWERDVKPGATGFLGATMGITEDDVMVNVVRFESEEAARRNSDRAEQGAWWEQVSEHLEDPRFIDCPDVDVMRRGGSDDAGFVQVMIGTVTDAERARELMEPFMRDDRVRPDVIGGTIGMAEGGVFVDTTYFTNEEEARAGEQQALPEAFQAAFEEYQSLLQEVTFFDLRDPWFISA